MKELIQAFPQHLQESIGISRNTVFQPAPGEIRQVLISGLGGSGIGGTIVADIARNYSPVPVLVNKDYHVPAFVGSSTLFIASSYSGGTEETLEALEEAAKKGAHIVCITSGGALEKLALEKGYSLAKIPGGSPPRAAFGYSFAQLICIFVHYGLLPASAVAELEKAARWIGEISADMESEAAITAGKLDGKLPVIYVEASMEGVAVRFRQQLNENSKMLAWHGVVPEMNHNELVGWTETDPRLAVVYLKSPTDYHRNSHRMKINQEIIGRYTPNILEIQAKGNSFLEHCLYHIHYGDWVSYHLALLRKVDIMEIKVIDYLKSSLANI